MSTALQTNFQQPLASLLEFFASSSFASSFNPFKEASPSPDNNIVKHGYKTYSEDLTCPIDIPFSCTNTSYVGDSCCFEHPGGIMLSTQFWDYNPSLGPQDAFTLHGLWPDNCDGTYEQFCDASREITNVAQIVEKFDETLLTDMKTYWKDFRGNDESLWYHEFNKHGTCYKTIEPTCYERGVINSTHREDVYDYFRVAVELYQTLPTFEWLASDGIVPSETETYTYKQIMDSLEKHFGATPFVKCDYHNAINEVWYFHHLKGSLRSGSFDRIDTLTKGQRCPSVGIKFPPKGSTISTSTASKTTTLFGPTPTDGSTRGFVKLSGNSGCLIRNGHWYASGSCATYTIIPLSTGSYTLKSSGGYCSIIDGGLTCAPINKPFEFNYDPETGIISANGQETWSADARPSARKQSYVRLGSSGDITFNLIFSPHN